jgi:Ca-activated chloride channel family protein
MTLLHRLTLIALLAPLVACGSETAMTTPTGDGTRGVTFGGAADIGQYRATALRGEVPDESMLDPVGFFAEHAIDLPPVDCGADVCVQSGLAVAPRFDGGNWTMGYVALRTSVDPSTLEREPTHLVVAIDRTATGADQLPKLLETLEPTDRVSVIAFDSTVDRVVEHVAPETVGALELRATSSGRDLFAAMADAVALAREDEARASRVVLLTHGRATTGITEPEPLHDLLAEAAREGIPTTVVTDADTSPYPKELAQAGGGTFYFAGDGEDMGNVLTVLGSTSLHPLATDLQLEVRPMAGYSLGRIFGAPAGTAVDASGAVIEAPALFVGARASEIDVETGRRGGGGGFFVELFADERTDIEPGHQALSVVASYTDASGEAQTVDTGSWNVLAPGQNPADMWPTFSNRQITKPFMMVNMYLGLRFQTELYGAGDCARARGVLPMMEVSVEGWQRLYEDPDIAADWELMQRVGENIERGCAESEVIEPTSYVHASCMFI